MADAGSGLQVEMVAADRTVWSGGASMVIARTTEGDVGVLRGHAPLLSLLVEATVEITTSEGVVHAAVDGGFISVAADRVSILSERAVLAEELSLEKARAELSEAEAMSEGEERERLVRRAEARIRTVEKAG